MTPEQPFDGRWRDAWEEAPDDDRALYVVTDRRGNYEVSTWLGDHWSRELRDVEEVAAWTKIPPDTYRKVPEKPESRP
jgi:hypothetical protein